MSSSMRACRDLGIAFGCGFALGTCNKKRDGLLHDSISQEVLLPGNIVCRRPSVIAHNPMILKHQISPSHLELLCMCSIKL